MGFVKVQKNKAYFKRFQVKYRRRREAKTDYYARKRLIMNDKNRYDTPKYRFVVRLTNRDVVCQIFSADLKYDKCLVAAYGHELSRYGLKAGFNNFAATYATGLLLARKIAALRELPFQGRKTVDGTYYNIGDADEEFKDDSGATSQDEHDKNPFKAFLDVGLHRTTTGCRLFAAVKGACDGGLNIPHGTKRFPGTDEKGETNFEVVKKYIFGGPVTEYMQMLKKVDEELYQRQFSRFIAAKMTPESLPALYASIHKAIRADTFKVTDGKVVSSKSEPLKKGYFCTRKEAKKGTPVKKNWKKLAISKQQRKNRVKQILGARDAKIAKAKADIEASAAAARSAAASADKAESGSDSGSDSGSGSDSD